MRKIATFPVPQQRAGKKPGAVMVAPILPKMSAELGLLSPHAGELEPLVATIPAPAIALLAPVAACCSGSRKPSS